MWKVCVAKSVSKKVIGPTSNFFLLFNHLNNNLNKFKRCTGKRKYSERPSRTKMLKKKVKEVENQQKSQLL